MGQPFRVSWYRFRTTLRRRWGGYLAIVLLLAPLGGLAMAAVAGARRTQSAYPRYLRSTNPSDLSAFYGDPGGLYAPTLVATVAHLAHVRHLESLAGLNVLQLGPDGGPVQNGLSGIGSVDGMWFDEDRFTVTGGRAPDPQRANETVTDATTAREFGLHVGSTIRLGFYTNEQSNSPGYGTAAVPPVMRADLTLVGVGIASGSVMQDDVERSGGGGGVLLTPAMTKMVLGCCSNGELSGLQLDDRRDIPAVEREIGPVLPADTGYYLQDTSIIEAKAERSMKPEAIALGVFGGIAALATLVIAGQVIGRQLRFDDQDLRALRALGASPSITTLDGLFGILGAVVIGSALAVALAVTASPLAPIGPVRAIDPSRGINADWTVLGFGVLVLIAGSGTIAVLIGYRRTPHRVANRLEGIGERRSTLARAADRSPLPVPAVTGVHFALESGRGGNTVPVRSAIVGAALAIVVVTGTLTFGASLHALVSHPALYGWNWSAVLQPNGGDSAIPQEQAAQLLDHDPQVVAWSAAGFDIMQLDGHTVPFMAVSPNAPVQPPVLSGHGLAASDQIVLGGTTLASLHKHVGDTVDAGFATTPGVTRLHVVGTATMPALGAGMNLHLSLGTGAEIPGSLIPGGGPGSPGQTSAPSILVRLRSGASTKSLNVIAGKLGSVTQFSSAVVVLPVQRPAEIVNYRSMGSTPLYLAVALAAGSVVALALTMIASVRRRRRGLALLKTLGFTRRQLAATVAWQSSVVVAIGAVVGVPLGIVVGRSLWILFAHEIHTVPAPTVPALAIGLVAVGSLILANVVAAVPGRMAARTPTAQLLRVE